MKSFQSIRAKNMIRSRKIEIIWMKAPEAKNYGMIDEVLLKNRYKIIAMSKKELICSFCGLSKLQTNLLVAGQDAHICDSCIEQAYGIVVEESKNQTGDPTVEHKIAKPKEIKAFLDHVVGQDQTKKIISEVAVYNHYKRGCSKRTIKNDEIEKSNVLIAGRTGTANFGCKNNSQNVERSAGYCG